MPLTSSAPNRVAPPPPLENGLIDGIVYMGSPVRAKQHGIPEAFIHLWLGAYRIATPGVEHATNSTVRLGLTDVAQPDGILRIDEDHGGASYLDEEGYIVRGPELVVEIAASSSNLDFWAKRDAYRRGGVQEYLLWRTEDREVDWWILEAGEYRELPAAKGLLKSRTLPGLWLDRGALIAEDHARVMRQLDKGLRSAEHKRFLQALRKHRR
jgi:Uma2 family endonuclease